MIDAIHADPAVVELLLCAADLARLGTENALYAAAMNVGVDSATQLEARHEVMAVAPRGFFYRGDLLADTFIEAAYRVAEGRGAASQMPDELEEAA